MVAATRGPTPRTRSTAAISPNGPSESRLATMRRASAGPMRGSRSISAAPATSRSTGEGRGTRSAARGAPAAPALSPDGRPASSPAPRRSRLVRLPDAVTLFLPRALRRVHPLDVPRQRLPRRRGGRRALPPPPHRLRPRPQHRDRREEEERAALGRSHTARDEGRGERHRERRDCREDRLAAGTARTPFAAPRRDSPRAGSATRGPRCEPLVPPPSCLVPRPSTSPASPPRPPSPVGSPRRSCRWCPRGCGASRRPLGRSRSRSRRSRAAPSAAAAGGRR